MDIKRIVLGVQYDGSCWQGWQTQPHKITVQDELESALLKFAKVEVKTVCAGRTDAGVHALEQVVHFDTELDRPLHSWLSGLNSFLPDSIAIRWVREVPLLVQPEHEPFDSSSEFHARFSAFARTYHYVLYNHPVRSPLFNKRAGWAFRDLNVELMQEAANYLVGEHDFTTFRAVGCQAKTPVKTMYGISVVRKGDFILFTLRANAFLHHMVRNIVGSLIFVGAGKRQPIWMKEVLNSQDRSIAAPTFMADGLYLARVEYDPKWKLPQPSDQAFMAMFDSIA
jgi:tRNA pseudouridine38-40 synthase